MAEEFLHSERFRVAIKLEASLRLSFIVVIGAISAIHFHCRKCQQLLYYWPPFIKEVVALYVVVPS